jgi:DNA-binding MarR family transcriptional regulator
MPAPRDQIVSARDSLAADVRASGTMNSCSAESEHVMAKAKEPVRRRTGRAGKADVDELVTAVLTASRALVGVSARSLAEVEDTVTITQFRTLVVLDNLGHINLLALAEELDVNSSTAMRMIDRLLVAGLVTRQENPDNRREVLLGLTADGARLVETVTRRRRSEIAKIVTAMPPERRTELVTALHSFADAASEPLARPPSTLGW